MISFNAFNQFHPTTAPQCNINNCPFTMIFIHTMHCWKQEIDWGVGDGVGRTHCQVWLMKTWYSYRFQGLRFIEERSDTPGYFLNNHNIGQTKELENTLLLLCRNSIIHIIHKKNKTQAAASTTTNATSNISNISLTYTATSSDSSTSSLIHANNITVGC